MATEPEIIERAGRIKKHYGSSRESILVFATDAHMQLLEAVSRAELGKSRRLERELTELAQTGITKHFGHTILLRKAIPSERGTPEFDEAHTRFRYAMIRALGSIDNIVARTVPHITDAKLRKSIERVAEQTKAQLSAEHYVVSAYPLELAKLDALLDKADEISKVPIDERKPGMDRVTAYENAVRAKNAARAMLARIKALQIPAPTLKSMIAEMRERDKRRDEIRHRIAFTPDA